MRSNNHRYEAATRRSRKAAKAKRVLRRRIITLGAILLLTCSILFGVNCRTMADSQHEDGLYKYYTSIEVKKGDSLWKLADEYMIGSDMTKKEYVDKLIKINGLSRNGEIHAGQSIIVVYYSNEWK